MTDTKAYAASKITYWWVGDGGIVNIAAPTPAEINAGINISKAIAVDSTAVSPSDSTDIDDRSIVDAGNAVEPGFDQYEAALNGFRPSNPSDSNDPYAVLYNLFKTQRVKGFLVKRRLKNWDAVAAAGEIVSAFYVMSDYTSNDTAGEDSVKSLTQFLPQGKMAANVLVKSTGSAVVAPATLSLAVGLKSALTATLDGVSITQGATWSSANTSIATVSQNGVVTAVASGSAVITAAYPSATTSGTSTVTVPV